MEAAKKGVTYFPKQGTYHGDVYGDLAFTNEYDSPVIGIDRADLIRDSEAEPISSYIDFNDNADPAYRILSNFVAPINNDKYCSLDRAYNRLHLDKSGMRQNLLHIPGSEDDAAKPITRQIQLTLLDHPIETLHSGSERYSYQDMVIQAQTIRYNRNKRERRALECLKELKYYYTKDKAGREAFGSTSRPDNMQNLSYYDSTSPDDEHRSIMIDEIQDMCDKFYDSYRVRLTHFVTNLKMMHALAINAFPSDTHNLEPYQRCIGIKKFPGMPDARLVASPYCDDYKLYAVSQPHNVMTLIEGPKRVKTWIGTDGTEHIQMLDYCQYACLQGSPDGRLHGCMAAFDSGEMK
ncbi:hypothetical protein CENSYa_0227 [Cenarchaeum symbiosum A]|uniref:Uncharacterized protein n=1 Tax=Cenarchaeum symbiosum (strain A) TaxID=414004 RepID=A0RU53_CENSY|nr:hypothetical protein CENSYa_0227 [Cenarchaeum symbiosum A]